MELIAEEKGMSRMCTRSRSMTLYGARRGVWAPTSRTTVNRLSSSSSMIKAGTSASSSCYQRRLPRPSNTNRTKPAQKKKKKKNLPPRIAVLLDPVGVDESRFAVHAVTSSLFVCWAPRGARAGNGDARGGGRYWSLCSPQGEPERRSSEERLSKGEGGGTVQPRKGRVEQVRPRRATTENPEPDRRG